VCMDLRSSEPVMIRNAKKYVLSESRVSFSFLWVIDQLGMYDLVKALKDLANDC